MGVRESQGLGPNGFHPDMNPGIIDLGRGVGHWYADIIIADGVKLTVCCLGA